MNDLIEIILNDFAEWIKAQPVYIAGPDDGEKEVVVIRDGDFVSAIKVYLKEVQPRIISEVVEE